MLMRPFIAVGENIHCTRIYKVGGKFCVEQDGAYVIQYIDDGDPCFLPVPEEFVGDAAWEAGKVKHCAVAIWQGVYGDAAGKTAGEKYLKALVKKQEAAGASYLDVNVDEFSTDVAQRVSLMKWTVGIVESVSKIPVSVDSSDLEILEAGLAAANPRKGRPMVNSVSLERMDVIDIAAKHDAVVIASAAGEKDLPQSCDERMANFARLVPVLEKAGLRGGDIHFDPLVFPISTDAENGVRFLETCSAVREAYGEAVHLVAGLSNVSFGMPQRKLINRVFARLAVDAGADGGIVDPTQINGTLLSQLDEESERFKLASNLLTGKDAFGMEFIMASRDGRLS